MPTNIYGSSFNDNLIGTYYADNLYGYAGNDWINGKLGADFMYGDAGDDVFWWDVIDTSGANNPFGLIAGGTGYDLIDMSNFVYSDLVYTDAEQVVWAGDQAYDFTGIEEIWLSDAADALTKPLGITAANSTLSLFLGGGNDLAVLAGAITVNGEAGNDLFRLFGVVNAGITVNGTVNGDAGVDTIRLENGFTVDLFEGWADAGDSRYWLDGIENVQAVARADESQSSIVYGNDLNNRMTVWSDTSVTTGLGVDFFGYGGNDFLGGSRAQDLLEGGAGADSLFGYSGADTLRGGDGVDRLNGGAGNDHIEGGKSRDILIGGTGADDFVFLSIADSRSLSTADTIVDFHHNEFDLIDLSAIDAIGGGADNSFAFIGNGAFHKTAGELRYRYDGTADTLVEADINGDGIADLVIRMTGEHALTAGDFVL